MYKDELTVGKPRLSAYNTPGVPAAVNFYFMLWIMQLRCRCRKKGEITVGTILS